MKLSRGFTEITPSIMMFVFYACAFGLNTVAVKTIELSVAYAIWSGVGTALTGAIGILYFKEPATAIKMVSLTLIIVRDGIAVGVGREVICAANTSTGVAFWHKAV